MKGSDRKGIERHSKRKSIGRKRFIAKVYKNVKIRLDNFTNQTATKMASANPESANNSTTVDLELKKVFDQFDSNSDGKISVSELGNVFKSMGTSYTETELNRVLDEIDIDRDGYINLEEFATICRSSASVAEIRDAFELYDQDKNGLISSSEIHKVLNRLGMSCSVEDCVRMIGHVDSDGDGNVNFEEFQKMMASPELLKSNGAAANAGSA